MLSWIEINADTLRQNYQNFLKLNSQLVPVLKSNAYGHGFDEVYKILSSENPKWLAVNYVYEAVRLRTLGFKGRILVVGPIVSKNFADALSSDAEVVVGNFDILSDWTNLSDKPTIHVKIDTGMSRQGFSSDEVSSVIEKLKPHKSQVVGIASHFANVEDVTDYKYARKQLELFDRAKAAFVSEGFQLLHHIASSASTLLLSESHLDLSRVGISLYGFWPSKATKISFLQTFGKLIDLQPSLSWKTTITTVKNVEAGQFLGYGCTYRAVQKMKIAVLPVGYYEGYSRLIGDANSYTLIKGQRCPVVGRICMNMTMVDISHLKDVAVGEVVTLIGTDGEETLSAEDVASWAQTIHYELVTCLHQDIPRKIV